MHSFSACITDEDLDRSIGIQVRRLDGFLVSRGSQVVLYNQDRFVEVQRVQIEVEESKTRDPYQIIAMKMDHKEQLLGVIIGKFLVKSEQ